MSNFDETFDFVVAGSGGGSMCAALMMRKLGKSVVILEKSNLIGGTTARSGGVMWIPNNRFMKEAGVEDSYEKAATYLDSTSGQDDLPGSTPERRATYLRESPKMIDFLVEQGIKLRRIPHYPDYYDHLPGGSAPGRTVVAELFNVNELPNGWAAKLRPSAIPFPAHLDELYWLPTLTRSMKGKMNLAKIMLRGLVAKLTGKSIAPAGRALQGRMLQAALKTNVDIRVSSGVDSLIMEDGAVKGVVTTKNGAPWRIGANLGVLINAGGFAQNQEMRDKYQPGTSAKWTGTVAEDTGAMIQEMMAQGAAVAQMDTAVGCQMALPPGRENPGDGVTFGAFGGQMDIAKPHSIIVDQTGVRYMSEGSSYTEFCATQRKRNETVPAIPSLWIMDDQYMKTFMFLGTMPGKAKKQEWYDSGWLKKADTIEELATLCNIDPSTLKATVDNFNADARTGVDRQFHRGERAFDKWLGDAVATGNASLGTIEQGPFYAAQVVPGDVSTAGGVVTDSNARVLREDGTPIPGLYATGTSSASVFGRFAVGAGSNIGPSFTWGYIAAKHAANASNIAG
jgi:3-oxosteroid 1-dehydrogenase